MLTMIFVGSLLVLASGLVAKYVTDQRQSQYTITWGEYTIASIVMLAIVIPLTSWAGFAIAYSNAVTYQEFWNGYELVAQWDKTKCERDGWCQHSYNCDPYQVPYDCSYYTGSGKDRRRVQQTCHRTEYHHCPYTTEEWTFIVKSTVGDFTIASHNLPTNPDSHRWRSYVAVPSGYESGIPWFWQDAKNRLDANKPGPVTVKQGYQNFILASQHTILHKYSADIERYKKEGVLPKLSSSVDGFYAANRVYSVGTQPPGNWSKALEYFNSALGFELQGNLYLVIVDSSKVSDPDTYVWALSAYWQSPEFAHEALSKNGTVVVLGSKDGQTVEWARAATGMPKGNEALLIDIRNKLPGTKLDPESVLGTPKAELSGTSVRVTHGEGALEKVMWGANKFERIHMKDYKYLSHEIEPTSGQKNWMYVCILLFGAIAWGICLYVGPQTFHRIRR